MAANLSTIQPSRPATSTPKHRLLALAIRPLLMVSAVAVWLFAAAFDAM